MKYALNWLLLISLPAFAQTREVAITIDDVPNVHIYKRDGFKSRLLKKIDSLNIPVAIFINEKNVSANGADKENFKGLEQWLRNPYITAGNHSYSHINYADTTLDGFSQDAIKGEELTTRIIGRRPAYFRFPFNSLGSDSISHTSIRKVLQQRGYVLTPYTVESEDWAYNALYEDALTHNDLAKAQKIGHQYVSQTVKLFEHFETLSQETYGRNIKHIYLCHDNQLNSDYLEQLVLALKNKGYSFITLEKALRDNLYQSKDYYMGRYGFSWLYRWEKNVDRRRLLMRREPVDEEFRVAHEELVKRK